MRHPARDGLASIEPRSFKRGNHAAAAHRSKHTRRASIEPRSFKRGNYFEHLEDVEQAPGFN